MWKWVLTLALSLSLAAVPPRVAARAAGQATDAASATEDGRLEALKGDAIAGVTARAKLAQEIVDSLFSFGELGFQEVESSRYLKDLLRREGFTIEEGISGIPTAWMASWGSGKPVIALGSDIDGIPKASQKPGVAYHDPLIEDAPGHGEGHNSGQAVNIVAALAVKDIMERERLPGTLRIWPGVAEELLGTKAYFVRDGYFKDVDATLFTHVSDNLSVGWGERRGSGLVSVEFTFYGQTAHSAGAPWRGRSALDAVELMNVGWNFRREHLRVQQRSHYVVTNGGDQPNVVPSSASVWYFFREIDFPRIKAMWDAGRKMAEGAALMTDTTVTERVLGSAWPGHFNKALAEVTDANIRRVGLPEWSEADQTLARALQAELSVPPKGLATELEPMSGPVPEAEQLGGGSDDIGDISWSVPTVVLRFPSNIPDLPGHNWANAVAMATPIAHKGAVVGAKVQALTLIDLLVRPGLVEQAWRYFEDVQSQGVTYEPLPGPDDQPATFLNADRMERFRERMKPYYYDPSKYDTYLDQLGIDYPTVRE